MFVLIDLVSWCDELETDQNKQTFAFSHNAVSSLCIAKYINLLNTRFRLTRFGVERWPSVFPQRPLRTAARVSWASARPFAGGGGARLGPATVSAGHVTKTVQ